MKIIEAIQILIKLFTIGYGAAPSDNWVVRRTRGGGQEVGHLRFLPS